MDRPLSCTEREMERDGKKLGKGGRREGNDQHPEKKIN